MQSILEKVTNIYFKIYSNFKKLKFYEFPKMHPILPSFPKCIQFYLQFPKMHPILPTGFHSSFDSTCTAVPATNKPPDNRFDIPSLFSQDSPSHTYAV
jgi:hypothetical protein